VWPATHTLAVTPSPKAQLQDATPTPPVLDAVKLTGVPTSVGFGLAAEATASFTFTVTPTLDVAVLPAESVTVNVALNGPVEV
jgi:hypothetical protein